MKCSPLLATHGCRGGSRLPKGGRGPAKEGGRERGKTKHPKRTGHSPTTLCTVLEQSPLERKSGRCAQRKKPGNWHKFLCPGRLLRSNESFKVPRLQPTRRVLTGWWRAWVKLCRVPAQEQPPYESGFLQKQLLRKSRLFHQRSHNSYREGPGIASITVQRRLKSREAGGKSGEGRGSPQGTQLMRTSAPGISLRAPRHTSGRSPRGSSLCPWLY